MDKNTQKRGELEPVIRHSTNFNLANSMTPQVQTLFIANELDKNVINIFRATQFIQLFGTLQGGAVNGLNIFPLSTVDVVYLLKNNITDDDVLNTINKNLDQECSYIDSNWYEPIRKEILSKSLVVN